MRRLMKVSLLIYVFGVLAAGCGSTPASGGSHTIHLAILPFTGTAPIYVAEKEHLCTKYGINLQIQDMDSQSALDTLMANGGADVGIYANTNLAFANAAGLPLQAFLPVDESLGADGIVATADIHSIQDMVTHKTKFGSDETDVEYFFFMYVASKQGYQPSDFHSIPLTGGDELSAFLTGQVSVAGLSEPELHRALQLKGSHYLFTTKDYPGLITDIFVSRKDVVNQRSSDLAALSRCWYDAVARVQRDPASAIPIMAQRLGINATDLQQLLPEIGWPDRVAGKTYLIGGGLRDSLQFTNDFYKRLGQLSGNPVPPDQMITDVVVKQLG